MSTAVLARRPMRALVTDTGDSRVARLITSDWIEADQRIAGRLQAELDELAEAASARGWDGEDGAPIDRGSLLYAHRLARLLPLGMRTPELSVDPDGEVSFEWSPVRGRSVSVSVARDGSLRWAAVHGSSGNCGQIPWTGRFPPGLALLIQRATSRS